jgi:hypothetical protein
MTVAAGANKHIYDADGVVTSFPYTFTIDDTDDIKIFLTNPAGVITEVTANYFIDTDNSAVIYPSVESELDPVPDDWKVTLVRSKPLTQDVDWQNGGNFNAEVLEKALDKVAMIHQQLQEQIDRCVKYPIDRVVEPEEMTNFLSDVYQALNDANVAIDTVAALAASASAAAGVAAAQAQRAVDAVNSLGGNGLRITEAQRDAILTWQDGDVIFNKDLHKYQHYDEEANYWQTFSMA